MVRKILAITFGILIFVILIFFLDNTSENKNIDNKSQTKDDKIQEKISNKTADDPPIPNENMKKTYSKPPQMQIDNLKSYHANIKTSKGEISVRLFANETPVTVNNFIFLAREGFYDKVVFHRIMENFMIQGGDPIGNGTGGPGYSFEDEPIKREYKRGTIAMANSGKNTNGSQFFIMHKDYPLPKNYVIFGSIEDGDSNSYEVLDSIATVKTTDNGTGEESKPTEEIVINSIEIIE
ncbi:peptidylprolyl isomerase [Patescibacteria group bacterium]